MKRLLTYSKSKILYKPTVTLHSFKNILKIPKGQSEAVNQRRTDNTMAKRKSKQAKTTKNKTLHRKIKIEQHGPHTNQGCFQVLRMGKEFLLHMWHPSCYSYYKQGGHSLMKKVTDYD